MSTGTLWASCSNSASSLSSLPKPKPPPPPQGNRPHFPQLTGRPDHVGPSFNSARTVTPPNSPPSTPAACRQFIAAYPARRAKYEQREEHRFRPYRRLYTAVREAPVRVFPTSCRGGLGLGKFSARKLRRRSRESGARRFPVFFQRGNLQCFPGHSQLRWSSGLASAAALFFGDELFHASGDFVVREHFPALDLRQACLHLAHKPLVVTNQSLHRFMDQRRTIAPLLGGHAVQLGLQFGRKFYFHSVSVKGGSRSVKVCLAPYFIALRVETFSSLYF